MNNYRELKSCVACDSENLSLTLDLNKQPLANSYKLHKLDYQKEYPLAINRCLDCYHVQLTHAVSPKLMFEDYLYVSGTSATGREHFKNFADYVTDKFIIYNNIQEPKNVLDIGCSDGTQLDYFKDIGYETYGVDPAKNLHQISSSNHTVWCKYFNDEFAADCIAGSQEFDVIVAQNVFAHTSDPLEFLNTAKKVMHDDSMMFIQTSQAFMIRNNEFDTIYHEHVSFFNIQSMKKLCERAGLYLTAVHYMPIHGTSYVFVVTKTEGTRSAFDHDIVDQLIDAERINYMYEENTYFNYSKNAAEIVKQLNYNIENIRLLDSWKVVGYGAAAKGMTLLNYSKINVDFIIDDNPLKQGRFTPGSSIPIYSSEALEGIRENILFIPLAWNFFDEIKAKIKSKRNNPDDRFITYFPKVEIKK